MELGRAALHPQHHRFMQGEVVKGKSSLWKGDFISWNKKGWTVHLSGLNGKGSRKAAATKAFSVSHNSRIKS